MVCKTPTTAACQRCGRPLCPAHQPAPGFRCAQCERRLEELLAPEAAELERARSDRLAGQRGARWALAIPVGFFAALLLALAIAEGSVGVGAIAVVLCLGLAGLGATALPGFLAARRSRRKLAAFLAEHPTPHARHPEEAPRLP